jgi:uncharacterized RDD family membrane protein YckC
MPYCKKCGTELPEGAKYCPVCGTPVAAEAVPAAPVTQATPEPQVASGVKLAFWGERFVAWLIDAVIVTVVMGIISVIIGLLSFFSGFSFTAFFDILSWAPIVSLNGVVIFFYWMFMESANGQSIGKMAMGIKVTRVDGSPINMGQAAVESIGKAFFPILVLDCLIGWLAYPKNRQRLFNYLSQTVVVKVT